MTVERNKLSELSARDILQGRPGDIPHVKLLERLQHIADKSDPGIRAEVGSVIGVIHDTIQVGVDALAEVHAQEDVDKIYSLKDLRIASLRGGIASVDALAEYLRVAVSNALVEELFKTALGDGGGGDNLTVDVTL